MAQRHEQSQAPPTTKVPVPGVTAPEVAADASVEVLVAATAAADSVETDTGAAADEVPPVIGEAAPVPFCDIAIALNVAWVLLAVGLMENVIPLPQ